MRAMRGWPWRPHAVGTEFVLTAHADPLGLPRGNPPIVPARQRGPMHAGIRELDESRGRTCQAAAAHCADAVRLGRFGCIGTRKGSGKVIVDDGMRGRARRRCFCIHIDAESCTAGLDCWLAQQVVYRGAAVGAPAVQAGAAHQTGVGIATRKNCIFRLWAKRRLRQADRARNPGGQSELRCYLPIVRLAAVHDSGRGRGGRRHINGCGIG